MSSWSIMKIKSGYELIFWKWHFVLKKENNLYDLHVTKIEKKKKKKKEKKKEPIRIEY